VTSTISKSTYHVCERLTEAVLCFAVVFNPWVFGTTQRWAIWLMNIAGYVLGGLLAMKWLVRLTTGYCPARWPPSPQQSSATRSRWLTGAMAVLTTLFLGYVLAGAINARAVFHVDRLDFEYFACIPWLPRSYDRSATWFQFWEYLGLACVFWATRDWLGGMAPEELEAYERAPRASASTAPGVSRHHRHHPLTPTLSPSDGEREDHRPSLVFPLAPAEGERAGERGNRWYCSDAPAAPARTWMHAASGERMPVRLRRLLLVLCLTGSLAAVEGIVQRLAGSNKLLFLVQPRFNQEAEAEFGPYAYRTNAAEYFNLLWPVCAGLAFLTVQAASRDRQEGRRRRGNAHRWLAAGAALMGAGPLIASSRGGSIIAAGMLPAVLVVMLTIPRGVTIGSKVGLGLLFAAAIQVAFVFGWDALEQRFEEDSLSEMSGRVAIYRQAQGVAKDHPLFGSGAGTFASLYWLYRTDPDAEWCAYLHNDWLEARITLGWIGFSLLLVLLAVPFAHWFLGSGVPLPGLLGVLICLAMAGCLVHARFDFPFRVHSVATVFLLYCSVLSCSGSARK
jgi:hypothetical protein